MPITEVEKIWMNGELVPWHEAKVHVLSHALHYGSGVFEGIRAYETERGPAVWHLDAHLDRMYSSASIYFMEIPYSKAEMVQAVKETIRANGLESCYIRPIAFRGYGEMGVSPLANPVDVSIAVWPWGTYLGEDALEQGVRVKISSWRRHDQNSLPSAAKATGGYLGSILAKVDAVKSGYDEGVLLNGDGYVTEGSGENIFVVDGGTIVTPHTGHGCLAGVTRSAVMTIARDLGFPVIEQNLVRTDLYTADEVFFTGTAAEITPIREVDDRTVGAGHRGPVTKSLQDAFFAATKGDDPRYADWLTYVSD
ncbi:MAG TPA: branched-chain amino acid transaminase [Actinomycetota bacterium]|nr:branched-chain amino acid transaminase [Actinomycetota bacterium]